MCSTLLDPASSCRGSTFWVTRKRSSPRNCSSRARARCAGLGWTFPTCRRRSDVKSRTARTAALRMAYIAYARTVAGWQLRRPTTEARASLRRRIEELFDRDWQDAHDGLYPRELIEGLPWREYAFAAPKLLADLPRTRERIRSGRHDELPDQAGRYPRYYARNFHYQT